MSQGSNDAHVQVHFTLPGIGAAVSVDTTHTKVYDCVRYFGQRGWTTGTIPFGGYLFPFENEADFDWALIGGRPWTNPDGEFGVWHREHFYKRRELEAVNSKKMTLPAAVKYSRGAKPSDPVHIVEKSDGDFSYVTLAVFRGGRRNELYSSPKK